MAIDVVDQLLDVCADDPIYVYHEIVHNRHVVERFKARGVTFVESIDEVPNGAIVVFSAHGISPAVRDAAESRDLTAIDATCPLVTKVHMEAIRYAKRGWQILLVGHEDHQEVIGTRGEAPDAIQVVETPQDIPKLDIHDEHKLIYLTQTTLSTDDANTIITALKEAFPHINAPPSEDICYATTNRQTAVRHLAPLADLVLVVGSRNSSNSVRLTEIAESAGTTARLIDDESEMEHAWFENVDSLLLTAGASAPEDLVRGVIMRLVNEHGATVEQHDIERESIEFGLPATLKREMRRRGVDPSGRAIMVDLAEDLARWMVEEDVPHRHVDLTIEGT